MADILCPIAEFAVILPGVLLAYLPMKQYLRMKPKKLIAIVAPLMIVLCIIGGSLCYFLEIETPWIIFPVLLVASVIYYHTLNVTCLKSICVVLSVLGIFSYICSIARAIDAMLCPDNTSPWFCLGAALIYNLMCWIFVILLWYPSTHAASELLEDEEIAQAWYIFWILPAVFIILNLFMIPIKPGILYQGRIMQGYIVISLVLLAILLLFYVLFYLIAKGLENNNRLKQENQFLSMQQAQYDNLQLTIEETRHARHDLRHHFSVLSGLAERKEWEKLETYLAQAQKSIPSSELNLCDNPAVDGVAGYYSMLYKKNNIPFSIELDLPHDLPVSEIDMCLVLSNLLENALEASLHTEISKRHIMVQAYLHSDHIVLLSVENAFDNTIKEKNGVFQSSKRHGDGVGIQSVRRIAEKNKGYSRFTYNDGIFTANIMLRAQS